MDWNVKNIPRLEGCVVVVTGASSGLGFQLAWTVAKKGAKAILAVRDVQRGEDAQKRIEDEIPGAIVEVRVLDLESLKSVQRFANSFLTSYTRLDVLFCNAGIMTPSRDPTADGFEPHLGVNHLGHFALVGLLLPLIRCTAQSRVVVVTSHAHRRAHIDLNAPYWQPTRGAMATASTAKPLRGFAAYALSKLCNLLFVWELSRRLGDASTPVVTAADPGATATNLQRDSRTRRYVVGVFARSPATGQLPLLRAAFDQYAAQGAFFAPRGNWIGAGWKPGSAPPVQSRPSKTARNSEAAKRLFQLSEILTAVKY